MKANITHIIPTPTWGKTLDLLQENKSIRISSKDDETFKKLLDSIGLKYNTSDGGKDLTRFTLESTEK